MTEEHEYPIENLAAYALGALEGPEQVRVESHVATCTTCASLLEQYRGVVGALPHLVHQTLVLLGHQVHDPLEAAARVPDDGIGDDAAIFLVGSDGNELQPAPAHQRREMIVGDHRDAMPAPRELNPEPDEGIVVARRSDRRDEDIHVRV